MIWNHEQGEPATSSRPHKTSQFFLAGICRIFFKDVKHVTGWTWKHQDLDRLCPKTTPDTAYGMVWLSLSAKNGLYLIVEEHLMCICRHGQPTHKLRVGLLRGPWRMALCHGPTSWSNFHGPIFFKINLCSLWVRYQVQTKCGPRGMPMHQKVNVLIFEYVSQKGIFGPKKNKA